MSPQRLKGDGPREPLAVERMSTPELEEEKRQGPRNRGIEAIKVRALCRGVGCRRAPSWGPTECCMSPQGQDRVRRSSVDLRREIIDVGSIQRLIELRKQRRKRREERAATPEPTPPPEPEEIVCAGCGRGAAAAGDPSWRSRTGDPCCSHAPALPCPAPGGSRGAGGLSASRRAGQDPCH